MSVRVFSRSPDGTAWEGHIAYVWSSVREIKLRLNFGKSTMPTIEEIYQLYGVCPALHIAPAQQSVVGRLDPVYRFLYGYSLNELMEVKEEESYSFPGTYLHEPQEWTSQMVMDMDWDLFCLAYYTFLCSNTNFEYKVWDVLGFILKTLKSTPGILPLLLSNCGRAADAISCSDFWETICDGLQTKSLDWLSEETCYNAFHSMITVRPLFSIEKYKLFESKCIKLLDEIAKARIDEACQKTYTVDELLSFNIELLFFYKDYFAQSSASKETERYVMNAAFTMLHTKGDKVVVGANALLADAVYKAALKYAQTESDMNLIAAKRKKISASVAAAKEALNTAAWLGPWGLGD